MLDMGTILVSHLISNALIAFLMVILWRENRHRFAGLSFWLADYSLQVFGVLLLSLRAVLPDFWSIIVANTLIVAGMLVLYMGLARFVEKPQRQIHNYLFLVCFVGLMGYFTYLQPDISVRTILSSASIVLLLGQASYLMLRGVGAGLKPITRQVGLVFLLYALVALTRIIYLSLNPIAPDKTFLQLPPGQVLAIFIYQMLTIWLTFGLMMMVTNRLQLNIQQHEADRKRSADLLQARLRLMQFAVTHSSQELLQATLDEAERLTGSSIGFYHFLDANQKTLVLQTWSTNTLQTMCKAEGKGTHYDIDKAGVWVDCVTQQRPVIHNDYQSLPHRKGLPAGHALVTRELVVPVFRGGQIVSILGIGNKPREYDQSDVEAVSRLADLAWDIAERKQAEERTAQEHKNFLKIFAASPVGLLLLDRETVITQASPSVSNIVLRSPVDIIGKRAGEGLGCVNSRENPQGCGFGKNCSNCALRHGLESVLAGGASLQGAEIEITLLVNGNLRPRWLNIGVEPLGLDGKPYVVMAVDDITKRKLAEEALRESALQYSAILETAMDGFWLVDMNTQRIMEVNDAYCRMSGYSRAEILQMTIAQFEAVERPPDVDIHMQRIISQRADRFETRHRRKDESTFPLEISVQYLGEGEKVFAFLRDITERKRAEEALLQANERLALAQKSAGVGLWDWDMVTGRLNWSPELFNLFGLDAATPPTFDVWRNVIHPQNRQPAEARINYALREHVPLINEYQIVLPSGEVRWINALGDTIYDEHGEPQRMAGICIDITERKRAEEALLQSKELYRSILQTTMDGFLMFDMTTRLLEVNEAYCQMSGYARQELLSLRVSDLDASMNSDEITEHVQQVIAQNGHRFETQHRRKDGSTFKVEANSQYIPREGGRIVVFIRDITERKHREHELEALVTVAAALRAALTCAEMLPLIIDEALSLLAAEAALLIMPVPNADEEVQVLARGAWVDWTDTLVLSGQSTADRALASGQPLLRGGEPETDIFWHEPIGGVAPAACVPLSAEGMAVAVLWIGRRLDLSAAELRLLMAVADIAANALHRAGVVETLERRVADRTRQLVEANRQLQELDHAKNQFVSNVSHELRAPLASIKLYLGLLDRGKPEKRAGYMQTLLREYSRLDHMIEDLLDLSRLDLGVTRIEPVPVDLNLLLSQLIGDRTALAAEHQLLLDYQPDPDLPFALIDPVMLTQVITNLLANAINYTPRGGMITVLTDVREQAGQMWVTFTVEDNGLGISATDLPHLFERFYRGEVGRKASAPGTGLGLAISKEIVEKMGGRITVVSEAGSGTAFTGWLRPAD